MSNNKLLPVGKLELNFLNYLLEKYPTVNERVIVGARVGVDAAVIDFGNTYLIAKTDPITFVTQEIGFYTIHINANDIACMGGTPRWFLATLLLPEEMTTASLVEEIFSQLSTACRQLDIAFCGGHTEVTYGINRPIVIGQMLGEVEKDRLITAAGAQPGDDVLLTKGIAIEATSIIAREKAAELAEVYSQDLVERCQRFIQQPGISVLKEARIASETGAVHAMHDPTEGGLATGLYELAHAANVGLEIDERKINILPESKLLCDHYGLDPLGAIASGALIITLPPRQTPPLINQLEKENISVSLIGKVVPAQMGIKLVTDKGKQDLPVFARDEIVKLF